MASLEDKCKDCNNPIYRDEKDIKFFEDLVDKAKQEGREFTMPRRCFSCRQKNKARKQQEGGR